ncbi:nucleotidyltransferase family protein [Candidatus Acetothermia bacterium]|nr:nucleotidyltransferase family protein [Candidatus Acetothermia bacterium]MBI3460288.1 nucleotidyltransferase family protein [Candidatus Acetothermia bacterium]
MDFPQTSAIVLAAGESRRMGQNKLLLPWRGRTVIESIAVTLHECQISEIIIVLGHEADRIRAVLQDQSVRFALNEKFSDGMLSSVQCGARAASASIDALLICLGDQPALSTHLIAPLLQAFAEDKGTIIVPSYRGARGHPLLVSSKYRDEILKLDPSIGLRQLRQRHADEVFIIEIPDGAVLQDLDYPEDYRRALENPHRS